MFNSEILSWLRSEFVVFVLAALGGIVVIIGLWWEYKSTDETRYEKAEIDEFRSLKSLEKRGEKWVIAGIIIEVIVAVLFAWRDDWHIRQIETAQHNADPRNLPINSISGYGRIIVRPKQGAETQFAMSLPQAFPDEEEQYSDSEIKKNETALFIFGKSPINEPQNGAVKMGGVAQVVFIGTLAGESIGIKRSKPYSPNICFDLRFDFGSVWNPNNVTINELKYVQIEYIGNGLIAPPSEVIGGKFVVFANKNWPKTF